MTLILWLILGMMLILTVLCIFLIVVGVRDKAKQLINPIRKDNSDYRFIEVKNEKTRDIFSIEPDSVNE